MRNKLVAGFFGTFRLVFGGCGSAVLASARSTWAGPVHSHRRITVP
jgi:glycerol uptake facilitator-like aquaporin